MSCPVMSSDDSLMSWLLLPPELWTQIFSLLPGPSLCSVSLVSRYFRDLARDPGLWRNVSVSRETIQRLGLASLLDCERLRLVERLDLSYLDLTQAGVEDLVRLVARLEVVSLRYRLVHHHWSSSYITALSLVETFPNEDCVSNLMLLAGSL